ncbi:MAG: hypothetical protein ACQEQF_00810 [Bacillota bacterium]
MKGWISLHRKIKKHWIWKREDYLKAWIYILLEVNHEPKKTVIGSELIKVNRGEKVTSLVKLSNELGWSRGKLNTFLNLLKEDEMITVNSTTKYTTIKVLNYNDYQGFKKTKKQGNEQQNDTKKTSKSQQKNIKKSAKKHQKDTNNNGNNSNNGNNVNNGNKKTQGEIIEFKKKKIPYEKVVDMYNNILGDLIPSVRKLSKKRKNKIKVRWNNELDSLEKWEELFNAVEEQDFLLGAGNGRNWTATFDWLIANDNNYVKVLERQYISNNSKKSKSQEKRRMERLYGDFLNE